MVGSTSVSSGLAALNAINDYEYWAGFDPSQIYQDIIDANEEFINTVLTRKEIFRETKQGDTALARLSIMPHPFWPFLLCSHRFPALNACGRGRWVYQRA